MNKNQRLDYMDAMRGVSMILVVFSHALLCMGVESKDSLVGTICSTFRMPLFFMVSGFFAYRNVVTWSQKKSIDILSRKFKAQIVCAIVFYALWAICKQKFIFGWIDNGFLWFWFTVALFQMYVIYWIVSQICKSFKNGDGYSIVTMTIISLLFFLLRIKLIGVNSHFSIVIGWGFVEEFIQFFTLGLICRKYLTDMDKLFVNDSFKTLVISIFFICLVCLYSYDNRFININSSVYRLMEMIIVRYSGLMTVFLLFYIHKNFYQKNILVPSFLRYVGKRTLDIYMLHMFFMPSLFQLGDYLTIESNMFLIQLYLGVIIALADISVCLLVSRIIRMSNRLANWLFGVKFV